MKGYRRKRKGPFRDFAPLRVKLKKRPSLFQRHQRLTSVMGALIVFTTFVVKDTLRENLKDKIGNLQSSIALFESTPGRILSSSETDADFESWQGYYGSKLQSPTIEFERKGPLELRKEEFNSELEKTDITYRSSGELLKQLDGFDELKRNHKALHDRLYPLLLDTKVPYAVEQNIDHMPKTEADAALKEARAVLYSAGVRIAILSGTVFSTAEIILSKVNEEQRALESKYKKITILSYFLYALGWTLALVGRLFNVAAFVSDSD